MTDIKDGEYSAVYLIKTAKILKAEKSNSVTKVQFFQRNNNSILCGINHVIEILKKESYDFSLLEVYALNDGDVIMKNEPVLTITGNLWRFIHLEGIIDGILTRESSIATNAFNLINAANKKEIIYMNDRSDYYFTQQWDGYAAYIGGIRKFVTPKQIKFLSDKNDVSVIGTIPHSLIQSFSGDLIESMNAYSKYIGDNNLVGLVDYNNDVINDSLKIANKFQKKLVAIRVDTSNELIDKCLEKYLNKYNAQDLQGVNSYLAKELRKSLDDNGFNYVKIIFSSGLDENKIKILEKNNSPVDFYGVGKYFSNLFLNFTCDAVKIDDNLEAKFGRKNIDNNKLRLIK